MSFERTLIISTLFSSTIVLIFLAISVWNRRAASGQAAVYFSIGMAATAMYTFGYGMELSNNSLPDIMLWVRFQHLGIQLITPLWVLFTLIITGNEKVITPGRTVILFIYPVYMLFATQTLGTLNLVHINPRLTSFGPFSTFTYDRGLPLYIGLAYINICLLTCLVLFIKMLFRSAPTFRSQAILFCLGSIIPFAAEFLYNLGLSPYNIDLIPFALTMSGIIFAFGLFRFHLLDIVPLARDVIFDSIKDGVIVLDNSNRIIDINTSVQNMLPGVSRNMIGKPVDAALKGFQTLVEFARENSTGIMEIEKEGTEGTIIYLGTISSLRDSKHNRVGKILTLHDNTQTRQLLNQLEELAARDSLTGIFNRRSFYQLATQNMFNLRESGGRMALIMLDLDHFKTVNDTYGHSAGDVALRKVTDTCQKLLRQQDIFGRYGGEEFVIFLPETDLPIAARIAERLRKGIKKKIITYEEFSFSVTASFGVAGISAKTSPINLDDLFQLADKALYQAKLEGRDRVCALDATDNPTGANDQSSGEVK
jgi:diguanylate cyclase (GGDEF)-like protein